MAAPTQSPLGHYIGRFAPSPSGPLHAGSLLAALASYLDAKAAAGQWLLRIEDVDIHRSSTTAEQAICQTLEQHQLYWDGEIVRQSNRQPRYQQALEQLAKNNHIFYCNCRRRDLRKAGGSYAGICRHNRHVEYQPASSQQPASHALRFDVSTATDPAPTLNDRIFGNLKFDLKRLGDFIIRRRDGLFAYQLAVVVDDMDQGITHIVRGSDLLESTPWQLALFDALGGRRPDYAHLPLLTHAGDNSKLSKQTGALAIDNSQPQTNLIAALKQLGQPVAPYSLTMPLGELLGLAIENWRIQRVKKENIPIKTNS